MSVYSFSDASRCCASSKAFLLGTTAFVFSALFSASLSFAEDAYVSECVGCSRGQYLNDTLNALSDNTYSSRSIQTSGLAADEFDTGLAAKSISSGNASNYDTSDDTNALLNLLESDAKATVITDSQRQVYVPPSAPVNAARSVTPKSSPSTPAFKEAALNVTPEEERYLRNGSAYLAKQAPAQQVKAAPVFDDYSPYMEGVRVAPIATYKAAMSKKIVSTEVNTPSPVANNEVAQPKEEVSAVAADNFVLSPAPSPAFTDSLKVENDTPVAAASAESQAPQISPLEALLLSDSGVDTNPTAGNKQVPASSAIDIPAFSDSFKSDTAKAGETKISSSAKENLLVPMDGGLYVGSGIGKEEDTYGGAVNAGTVSKGANGGYGTDYASFVPSYAGNQSGVYADRGVSNDSDFKPITTVALNSANTKAEKAEDKGIIGKLKDWFTVSDNSGTPAKRTDSAKISPQIPVTKAPAADTVDEILARYEGKNKQRNDSQTIATDPTVIAVVFGENSANASTKTVRRLSDFAENAARSKNSILKIQVSKVNLSLQAKRFALIKSILISNGISLDRIRPSVDGDNPNTVVLRVETPIYAVGAYEKIEAMGGQ